MPAEALKKLRTLVDQYEAHGHLLPLREQVKALVEIQEAAQALSRASILPEEAAGKARILAYFRANVGEIIDSTELAVVSGIKDYPRRIRELRVEEGWPIISGAQSLSHVTTDQEEEKTGTGLPAELRPDQYMLLADRQDTAAAQRWQLANEIRRQAVGVKEKLLTYFRKNVGSDISIEELRYVSNNSGDWPRRTRELRTEDGWPIVTRLSGDPSMPHGMYKLAVDRQDEPHDRRISESIRREVIKRDGGRCRWKGCGWPGGFPEADHRFLEVHHIVHHVAGGANTPDNLVTLCNLHHDEVHRTGGILHVDDPPNN